MPTPADRLALARAMLDRGTTTAACAATHLAYYACVHHCAPLLGLKVQHPGGVSHHALVAAVDKAALADPERLSSWRWLRMLRTLRERGDYRPEDPPSQADARRAVEQAELILQASPAARTDG